MWSISRYKRAMTTRKPEPSKQARPSPPAAERPASPKNTPKPSQADEAHIATAGYWREQRAAIDRIAKLKAQRLAQGDKAEPAKPKPKKTPPSVPERPRATRRHRWGT
jgi:hypothetical protein